MCRKMMKCMYKVNEIYVQSDDHLKAEGDMRDSSGFSSYIPCACKLKIKIADDSFSAITEGSNCKASYTHKVSSPLPILIEN